MAHALTPTPGGDGLGLWPQRSNASGLPLMAGGLLVVVVVLAHLGVMKMVGDELAHMHNPSKQPERVQVRYVREMALAPPPASTTAPSPPVASRPARNTGAPLPRRVGHASPPVAQDLVEEAPPAASKEESSAAAAQAASSATASAASSAPVAAAASPTTAVAEQAVDPVWPQTTRVTYAAQGYFNGEFYGDATVEWVRQGDRYQMHMDVSLGLGMYQRIASSRGRISEQGAEPERFDETIKRLFAKTRQFTVSFDEDQIAFSQGNKVVRPAGVQDTTSQFVQLTYLFAKRPELAEPGQRLEFPLAFHRNLRAYAYEVQGRQVLQTVLGPLETLHVIPRRVDPKSNDLVAQIWFAPAIKYLPARIRFNQGEDIYIELNIRKAPELAH